MKLKKTQRTQLVEWIAEGLETGEINKRAARFKPPFNVTRQQVDHYRKTRDIKLKEIKENEEFAALKSGLSLRDNRVLLLHQLAEAMRKDLLDDSRLWLTRIKGIGSAENFQVVEEEEFNGAEVAQLRGVLDDIAAELNERIRRQEVSGPNGKPVEVSITELEEVRRKRWEQVADRLKDILKKAE